MGGSKKEQKEDIRVIYQVIMLLKDFKHTLLMITRPIGKCGCILVNLVTITESDKDTFFQGQQQSDLMQPHRKLH